MTKRSFIKQTLLAVGAAMLAAPAAVLFTGCASDDDGNKTAEAKPAPDPNSPEGRRAAKQAAKDAKRAEKAQAKKIDRNSIADIAVPAGVSLPEVYLAVVAAATSFGPALERARNEAPAGAASKVVLGPKSHEWSPWQISYQPNGLHLHKVIHGAFGSRGITFKYVVTATGISHDFEGRSVAKQTARHIVALDNAVAANLEVLARK
jgi:hypothetical protein